MGNEKFKVVATDMLPLIEEMKEVLKKHEVDCTASVSISANGYFNFFMHKLPNNMSRIEDGKPIKIYFQEEVQ